MDLLQIITDDEVVTKNQINYIDYIVDLNDLKSADAILSVARFRKEDVLHSPDSSGTIGGVALTLNFWTNQGVQLCTLNNETEYLYIRFLSSNVWNSWRKLSSTNIYNI